MFNFNGSNVSKVGSLVGFVPFYFKEWMKKYITEIIQSQTMFYIL